MKKIILTLATLLLSVNAYADTICCEVPCCSSTNFYVKGTAGSNWLDSKYGTDYNTGYLLSGAVGYRFCFGARLEGEYAYRNNNFKHFYYSVNARMRSSALMVNAIYDIPLASCMDTCGITPFIGAGIGCDFYRFSLNTYNYSESAKANRFAWQILAGLDYPLNDCLDATVEYKFNKATSTNLYNNSLAFGVTYKFGA